eukprot:CAMPEP_0172685514 /NCGR_PEP_ID=MMETSP1074-20121228/20293_1 /TAXON_ID=2916 /ORGANISM="Ceratium fusus, Strain PA161109" /LENGTH=201 /DNA_ID=CAMNT_0013504671 /DNA_START=113 /DNA_END=718 /DNA_ORIENTATION=+
MPAEDSVDCCTRRAWSTSLTGWVTGLFPMQTLVHGAEEARSDVPTPELNKLLADKTNSVRRAEVELSRAQILFEQEKRLQKREKAILGSNDLEGEIRLEDQERSLARKDSDEEKRLLNEEKKLSENRLLLLAEEEKLLRKSRELAEEEDKLEAVLKTLRADEEELAEGTVKLQTDEQRIRVKRRDRALRISSLLDVAEKLR